MHKFLKIYAFRGELEECFVSDLGVAVNTCINFNGSFPYNII